MMGSEKSAGTAKAGLNFVEDKESTVFPAEFLSTLQVVVGRQDDSGFALDGLEDQSCEFARGEMLFENGQVAKVHELHAGNHRTEAVGPEAMVHERERTAGESVEGAAGGEEAVAAGGCAGELDG